MPRVEVLDMGAHPVGAIDLSDQVFAAPVKEHLLQEVVRMQQARRRAGSASTKGRGEVSGGGAKPYRQKGTGRARAGSNTSPLWRRGGAIFGPRPRDYAYSVPKKVRRAALRAALTLKREEGQLRILAGIEVREAKTREMVQILKNLGVADGLLVLPGRDARIERAARNLRAVHVLPAAGLNVYDVLRHKTLLVHRDAVPLIEGTLAR